MTDEARVSYKTCFVPMCKSTTIKTPGKVFIHVPENPERRFLWCAAAGCPAKILRRTSYCCEDHFNLQEDLQNYYMFSVIGGRKRLKENVVPRFFACQRDKENSEGPQQEFEDMEMSTVTQYSQKTEVAASSEGFEELEVTAAASNLQEKKAVSVSERCEAMEVVETPWNICDIETLAFSEKLNEAEVHTPSPKRQRCSCEETVTPLKRHRAIQIRPSYRSCGIMCKPTTRDVGIRTTVETRDAAISPISDLDQPRVIKQSITEVQNTSGETIKSSILDSSYSVPLQSGSTSFTDSSVDSKEIINLKETIFLTVTKKFLEDNPLLFLGLPKGNLYVLSEIERITRIPLKHIYLILKKIRLNHTNAVLAYDFGISESGVAKIFKESLGRIASILGKLIVWPSKNIIQRNLPIQFRYRYKAVQSIIDCFEIQIEKPANAVHQATTWSEYKKCNTAKYLISCTPDGLINYVSNGYGGRASDTSIFEDCGYLEVLPVGASVLADRGFKQISTLLEAKRCKLVCPPSASSFEKSSKESVKLTRQVASVRIHIERVIRRIREFKFLETHVTIDKNYLSNLDEIVTIAAALINLQSRIINQ